MPGLTIVTPPRAQPFKICSADAEMSSARRDVVSVDLDGARRYALMRTQSAPHTKRPGSLPAWAAIPVSNATRTTVQRVNTIDSTIEDASLSIES